MTAEGPHPEHDAVALAQIAKYLDTHMVTAESNAAYYRANGDSRADASEQLAFRLNRMIEEIEASATA